MELIDSHCHIDLPAFAEDRADVLARSRAAGICGLVVPAVAAGGWQALWQLAVHTAGLYPAFGLHPVFLAQHRDAAVGSLEDWVDGHRPVAVGEIGLDYHVDGLNRQRQLQLFEAQLEIARSAGLPVILHVRKAHDEVIGMLRRIRVGGGIVHAFNGSLQQAQQYRDLGFVFGFGGMLTYERSRKLRALARELPLATIVLETDAPDMTVAAHRGERNSPEYLPHCLHALAEVRDMAVEEVAVATTRTAREVLGLGGWSCR